MTFKQAATVASIFHAVGSYSFVGIGMPVTAWIAGVIYLALSLAILWGYTWIHRLWTLIS